MTFVLSVKDGKNAISTVPIMASSTELLLQKNAVPEQIPGIGVIRQSRFGLRHDNCIHTKY